MSPETGDELANADVSTARSWKALAGGTDEQLPHTSFPVWADVRSVAEGLYEVINREENGRFIICNGTYDFEILNRIAQKVRPDLFEAGVIPRGKPNGPTPISDGCYSLDNTKSKEKLDIKCEYSMCIAGVDLMAVLIGK